MVCSTRRTLVAVIQIVIGFRLARTNALPVNDRFVSQGIRRPFDPFRRDGGPLWSRIRDDTARAFESQTINRFQLMGRRNGTFTPSFLLSSGNNNNNINNKANGLFSVSGWFTRKNFLITGLFLLVPPILLEIYSRVGVLSIPNTQRNGNDETANKKYISFVPPPRNSDWSNIEHATIVFHGAGGEDAFTSELMKGLDVAAESKSKSSRPQTYYNHIVDWSKYSANILQASYNGQQIGKLVARELLHQASTPNNNSLKTIHFIGISVGAFSADAAVNEVKKHFENSNDGTAVPFVQLTLLDPFQQRGIFGVGYGNNVFGKSADYAQQYLNTDDPVPSTNKPLKNTVCYDVTNLRPESVFGHDWPLVYYARSDRCGELAIDNQEQQSDKISGQIGTTVVL